MLNFRSIWEQPTLKRYGRMAKRFQWAYHVPSPEVVR